MQWLPKALPMNIFDHWGVEEDILYSEPYMLTMEDVKDLLKFAEKHNLTFIIRGSGKWNDGVMRIEFRKKPSDAPGSLEIG